ncbi:unnamed protein product [Bursaphelenchus xylophilus]|uniref:(pine wood nematode) hypothetical protein n=1 Tax=Bursaphelenchus xylophilus TaxID=6326 RepID=A0A1I7S649_BURXY|nr:unnamed protein product [Bursaphelenchus xylophilus]CAG9082256.1 unnamed protein product [Bursaphelenchus xylophilus]
MLKIILCSFVILGAAFGAPPKPVHDFTPFLNTVAPEHRQAVSASLKCADEKVLYLSDDVDLLQYNSSIFSFFLPFMIVEMPPENQVEGCLESSDDPYLVAVRNLAERLAAPFRAFFRQKRSARQQNFNPFKALKDQCRNLPSFKLPCEIKYDEDFGLQYLDAIAASAYVSDVISPGSGCRFDLKGRLDKRIFEKGNSQNTFQVTLGCSKDGHELKHFDEVFSAED